MPYKACVYKGCENYTYDCAPCGNKKFTIFRFPKDPARYEQWMKRGKVTDGLPETQMLMCSDHFEGKYIVRNARRTILTSTAVPIPYHEESVDIEGEDNIEKECEVGIVKVADALDTEMVFSIHGDLNDSSTLIRVKESGCEDDDEDGMLEYDRVDNNLEAEYCVESTTMKDVEDVRTEVNDVFTVDRFYAEEHLSDAVRQPVQKEISFKSLKSNSIKRRITNSSTDETQEPSSSKIVISTFNNFSHNSNDNSMTVSKRKIKQRSEDNNKSIRPKIQKQNETRPDSPKMNSALVNTEAVTCFIFKGEEYVQMPKEYYMQEKLELMEKLKNYENILRTFKQNLLDLDLS